MPNPKNSRKARFRAALALAGLTAEKWAAENGISTGHLSQVLSGKRDSRPTLEKIEAFTKKHVRQMVA